VLEEGQEAADEQAELGELASEVEGETVPESGAELREVEGDRGNFGEIELAHLPGELQPRRHHHRQYRTTKTASYETC